MFHWDVSSFSLRLFVIYEHYHLLFGVMHFYLGSHLWIWWMMLTCFRDINTRLLFCSITLAGSVETAASIKVQNSLLLKSDNCQNRLIFLEVTEDVWWCVIELFFLTVCYAECKQNHFILLLCVHFNGTVYQLIFRRIHSEEEKSDYL